MRVRPLLTGRVLRFLCLVTAVVNVAGAVGLAFLYDPLFDWLGVPLPADLHLFAVQLALAFAMGVVAFLVFLRPEQATGLLVAGILGKGSYAVITYYFWATGDADGLYLLLAGWDALFAVVFFLYWIQLTAPELRELQLTLFDGIDHPDRREGRHALVVGYSLTGNGRRGVESLAKGLISGGYVVDVTWVVPQEAIFRFPMSIWDFVRIIGRALLRRPARIAPLQVPDGIDWDLVVIESPVWLLGMAAPVEAVFEDPANRRLFLGRDAAALVVSRGAYQRTLAMMVRHLERAGANVVGALGLTHEGREPRRLMSLWLYLVFRRPGFPPHLAAPRYGPSERELVRTEAFGFDLAGRSRTRPHWTIVAGHHVDVGPNPAMGPTR